MIAYPSRVFKLLHVAGGKRYTLTFITQTVAACQAICPNVHLARRGQSYFCVWKMIMFGQTSSGNVQCSKRKLMIIVFF